MQRRCEIAGGGGGTGEDQRGLAFMLEQLDEHSPLVAGRCIENLEQRAQSCDLVANLGGIRLARRREEIPEQNLLKRVAVFFVRERAAVVALRKRASGGDAFECAIVEAQLPLHGFGKRGFARLEAAPEKTAKDRMLADEW